MTKIFRPIQFDKPRKERQRDARNKAARDRRAKKRDQLQRRMYRMVEPSFGILWEHHDNDNNPRKR